jgi:hypothetical protein
MKKKMKEMKKYGYKSSIFQSLLFLLFLLPVFQERVIASDETGTRLPPPEFSHKGGFYGHALSLHLSTDIDGADIYYTLDGSVPDPANLTGTTYNYKNIWIQRPGEADGNMLTESYITNLYSSAISIVNRQNESDRLSQKASSYHNPPYYIPSSPVYKGTVVRAITVKAGYAPSEVATHTFFIGNRARYSLPVISITTSEDNLFDYYSGIYTPGAVFDNWRQNNPHAPADGGRPGNYHLRGEEWEYPAHFTFWDSGSTVPDLSQDIGFRLHGGWSRAQPMKTLRLYARSQYGKSTLEYPFFPEQDYGEYKRVILRNSGNDNPNTMFRDALIQRVCRELNFDTQAYRPAVVFINGEYWGVHNIRERYDKHYIKRVYGVEEEELDLLTGRHWTKEGDNLHYNETIAYIEENGLQDDAHYEYIKTRIDTENFIDYQIANIYSANTDWPSNNIDFWRKRTSSYQPHTPRGHDGRWRWMAFDMDFGFGIWGKSAAENVLEFATATDGPGWPNPPWSTFLLRSFLENESFTADFVNRFAGLLNTSFRPERVISLLDEYQQVLEPEMPEHITRWKEPVSMDHSGGWQWNSWQHQVSFMRNFATERPDYQWGHLMNYFDLDTISVAISVSSGEHGYIRVNDIDIIPSTPGVSEDPYPWTGTYLSGIPVTIVAVPAEGYMFSHWEGSTGSDTPVLYADPSENISVTAHFITSQEKLIHYWHFNNLSGDDTLLVVTSDYSAGEFGEISYPGTGTGYMDIVNDGTQLNRKTNILPENGLRVRNPSDTRELVLSTPSTGFDNLVLTFAVKRTSNGAWNQTLFASSDMGENWTQVAETFVIEDDWHRVSFDLSGFPELNDNPGMMLKIGFGGENAGGTSGNNRFDNISLTGEFLYEYTSYYNKPGSSLNEMASWGNQPDGTGENPLSFDVPGAVYYIFNGTGLEISANWLVSGVSTRVVLGNGNDPVNLTIPPDYHFSGRVDINANASLVLKNPLIPILDSISTLSTIAFEQHETITIPARAYGNLHLKNGTRFFSGNYIVAGNFLAENSELAFTDQTILNLGGNLNYLGNVVTSNPEWVNLLVGGGKDQIFLAENNNTIDVYNFYAEKTTGTFTMAADLYARNNLRLNFTGNSMFSDGGHILKLKDDLRLWGNQNRYNLTGTIYLAPERGTNDIEILHIPVNNLVINAGGDARVDFDLSASPLIIKNDLVITSTSSRPVRLRDKSFHVRGNVLLDVAEKGQIGKGSSHLVFSGQNQQFLENTGYDGPGLFQDMSVNGAGLTLKNGSVTFDGLISFKQGVITTGLDKLLKLGPGGSVENTSTGSYVNGPMGIYNNSMEKIIHDFPVGKENGMRRIVLETERETDNQVLYIAEYFNETPQQLPLAGSLERLSENHGYYSISADNESHVSKASVSISYTGTGIPDDSVTIAWAGTGTSKWANVGSEFVTGQKGIVRSTINFSPPGLYTLAFQKYSPVSAAKIETFDHVYPNPVMANGVVYLPERGDVTLLNITGVPVLSVQNTNMLNLQGIPPGVYIIKHSNGTDTKLIIMGRP